MWRPNKIIRITNVWLLFCSTALSAHSLSSPPVIFKSEMVRSINATEQWSQEDRTWRYQTQSQTRFLFGNSAPRLSSGLQPTSIGGVGLADQWNSELFGKTLQWRYGATVGLVDQSQDLYHFKYGSKVGRAWFDLALTSELSVDAIYQRADDYEQLGLGTQYQLGPWGSWSVNVLQSSVGAHFKGQRYQGLVAFDLTEGAQLELSREKYNGRFVRLNQNRTSPTAEQSTYRAAVRWDTGRWGLFQARYANTVVSNGNPQHVIGLGQQVWYSPKVRIDLDAQRQTHSGDYNMGLRLSFPIF